MSKKIWLTFSLICLLFLAFSAVAAAQSFSADIVMKSGNDVTTGKVFVAPQKMRMEMEGMITITRMDLKLIWMIMPEEKMYMEMAIKPGQHIPSSDKMEGEVERVLVGSHTIDGKAASKYRITVNTNGQKESFYQWIASDSGFPVKMAALDNSWSHEYRNLVMAEPAASLFELPGGYTKMSMPGM